MSDLPNKLREHAGHVAGVLVEQDLNRAASEIERLRERNAKQTLTAIDREGEIIDLKERIEEMEKASCEWTYDDHHDVYEGSCGVAWCMIEGGAEENGVKYCPGCGGAVTVRYPEIEEWVP